MVWYKASLHAHIFKSVHSQHTIYCCSNMIFINDIHQYTWLVSINLNQHRHSCRRPWGTCRCRSMGLRSSCWWGPHGSSARRYTGRRPHGGNGPHHHSHPCKWKQCTLWIWQFLLRKFDDNPLEWSMLIYFFFLSTSLNLKTGSKMGYRIPFPERLNMQSDNGQLAPDLFFLKWVSKRYC